MPAGVIGSIGGNKAKISLWYLDYKFFYDRIIMKTMKIYTRRRIYETNKSEHFNYRSIN